MKSKSLIVLLAAIFPLLGCASAPLPDETGSWQTLRLEDSPPTRDLLLACEYAIEMAGYPKGETVPRRGTVSSDWLVNLQPFRNKGMRYQGILRIFSNDGKVVVKSRVIAERNIEMSDTLDPGAAEWEPTSDDIGRSRTLLQFLRSQLYLRDN
ncbi:MAG: hypothetical protein H8E25_14415 [Planctomycetes bacterium]|nr:hypothetical protein [Planctomycetota bacterium]